MGFRDLQVFYVYESRHEFFVNDFIIAAVSDLHGYLCAKYK